MNGAVQMNRASDKASDEIGGTARDYQRGLITTQATSGPPVPWHCQQATGHPDPLPSVLHV